MAENIQTHSWFKSCSVVSRIMLAALFLIAFAAKAQLIVTAPTNKQIVQRDTAGLAAIAITAYALKPYTSIRGQLTPVAGNLNQGKIWTFDAEQLRQGFLTTSMKVKTGWYQLKNIGGCIQWQH